MSLHSWELIKAVKNSDQIFSAAESRKKSHYKQMAIEQKAKIVPFAFTIGGKLNEDGNEFIKELAAFSSLQAYPRWSQGNSQWALKRQLSVLLQKEANQLIREWKRLNRADLGMHNQ
jgi:hypothetical protein